MKYHRSSYRFAAVLVGALAAGVWIGSTSMLDKVFLDSIDGASIRVGPEDIHFVEVQHDLGVSFTHFDSRRASLLPEDVGSGVAWVDYDNDGDDDLFFVNFAGPFLMEAAELAQRPGNRLFRNDRGSFRDVTRESGLGHVGWDYACLWFDYDNDGWLDVAVSSYSGLLLYRNLGNGGFANTTEQAQVAGINKFLLGMTSADYDLDGDLDLYLCGYVQFDRDKARTRPLVSGRPAVWTNPTPYTAEANVLLQNNGDGTFADVTTAADVANLRGKSMQAVFCDFDNDGWPDLYVANDVGTADVLYHNQQDGTFKDVSLEAGTHDRRASMGLAVGDVWHRGWLDLFATHWVSEHHALWKNRTAEFRDNYAIVFEDVGPKTNIVKWKRLEFVGWGTGLIDFDNDGTLDLMVVNGSTIEDELTAEVLTNPKLMPQTPQILQNMGDAGFVDVSSRAGSFFQEKKVSRGLAFSDYNLDGRMDAAVVSSAEPATILQNVTERTGHWVSLQLRGTAANRYGVGARVRLKAGATVYSAEHVLGTSYLSSNSYRLHFGLGEAEIVDWVEVRWPGGGSSRIEGVPVDRVVSIEQ